MSESVAFVESAVAEARPHHIVTANALMLNAAQSDSALAAAIREADLVVPDGAGLLVAARLTGQPLRGRVPGIDLLRALCGKSVRRGWRVLLMGAKPGVALAAAERLRNDYPGLAVSAVRDGYFRRDEEPAVLHDIKVATPDLLFVALGMDRQERWIAQNLNALGARVVMGVGGALDVIAGRVPRAPARLQAIGGEWLWRLAQEPSRWRRMMGLPIFVLRVLWRSAPWRAVLLGGALLTLGLLAYGRSFHQPFLWDDARYILESDCLHVGRLSDLAGPDYYRLTELWSWRPLGTAWDFLNARLWNRDPEGWRITGLLLHMTMAGGAGLLGRRLAGLGTGGAAVASLIYLVHPVHVEAVHGATFGKDIWAALFALGGLAAAASSRWGWSVAAFTSCLMTKEIVAGAMGGLLLGLIPEARRSVHGRRAVAGMATAAAIWLGLHRLWVPSLFGPASPPGHPPMAQYLAAIGWLAAEYGRLLVWPVGLKTEYRVPGLPSFMDPKVVFGWIGLAALAWLAIRPRGDSESSVSKASAWLLAGLWLPLVLHPLFLKSHLQERYLYLPAVGVAWWFAAVWERFARRSVAMAGGLLIAVLAGGIGGAAARVAEWRDPVTFLEATARRAPDNAWAQGALANAYAAAGRHDDAIIRYRDAVRLYPGYVGGWNGMGLALQTIGRIPEAEAAFRNSIRLEPRFAPAHTNLAILLDQSGRRREARPEFEAAVSLEPGNPRWRANLARFEARHK